MTPFALVSLLALLFTTPAAAAPTVLLLIDASPSMGGEVATAPAGVEWWRRLLVHAYGLDPPAEAPRDRLGTVRAAVVRYVAHLEATTTVGVRSFGQRRWLGCEDSQLLLPPSLDRGRCTATLAGLQAAPAGNTPLAYALREAARDLLTLPAGGDYHIVVFTDATDLCPEPLPAGDRLTHETGVAATLDVITLGLTPAAAAPLAVICRGTGGHLYPATDLTTAEIALRRCLPLTPRQHLAAALRLDPGAWPVAVAALVLLLLALIAWLEVRSEG